MLHEIVLYKFTTDTDIDINIKDKRPGPDGGGRHLFDESPRTADSGAAKSSTNVETHIISARTLNIRHLSLTLVHICQQANDVFILYCNECVRLVIL